MQLNLQPLKEPRGFIRVLQIFFAILAFSTTTGYDNQAEVTITCTPVNGTSVFKKSAGYALKYPFTVKPDLEFEIMSAEKACMQPETAGHKTPVCTSLDHCTVDKSTTAEFYVTTGVLAFLYSLAAVVVYVMLDHLYINAPIIPFFDLVGTGVLTLFWFLGWCSWVAQWGNVKGWYEALPNYVCDSLGQNGKVDGYDVSCSNTGDVKYSKLTISLIFGFANIILWAGSSWFVFKETSFHTKSEMQASYINPDAGRRPETQPGP